VVRQPLRVVERDPKIDAVLRRRAQLWMSDVFTQDADAWREDAAMLITDHPALLAVLRADPSWEIAGSDPGKEILREVLPEARRREADADSEWIVGPLPVQGRHVFGVQVRASREGDDTRTVFAVLAADRLLPDLLDSRAAGYAVSVSAGGADLFRRVDGGPHAAGPRISRSPCRAARSGRSKSCRPPMRSRSAPGSRGRRSRWPSGSSPLR
jgi:hypothetical protein